MSDNKNRKQLVTAAGTFAVALSIGFVMQYGDAVAGRLGSDTPISGPETRIEPETVVIPVAANVAAPTTLEMPSVSLPKFERVAYDTDQSSESVPAISLPETTAPNSLTLDAMSAPDETPDLFRELQDEASEALEASACDSALTATPNTAAMVDLSLSNPCRPDAIVTVHHQGMMFHALTDENGALSVSVPALSQEAFFIVAYDDGEGAVAITGVPDLALYDRAVLQWQGEDDVQLHALEFGASYGEDGHIWAESRASVEQTVVGAGGVLTRLGQDTLPDALMAEVYTFPSGLTLEDGTVALSVEAEVTARNCGREVNAETIQIIPGAEPIINDLNLIMPDCDAAGEFLVLKNMFEDLTLAAR